MELSAEFFRWMSMVSPTRTRMNGPGTLTVEGPVAEGGAFRESALDLDAEQIDAHGLRVALADRRRQVGGVARDVGLDHRLRRPASA